MADSFAFVSDVHLEPGNKRREEHFGAFLDCIREGADRLYILGDLFDYWIGHGHERQPEYRAALAHIRRAVDSGLQVILLHGNRDFLLNSAITSICGATVVGDELRLDLNGTAVHLCHGDGLCDRDHGHRWLHAVLRSRAFGVIYGSCPYFIRDFLARVLRLISRHCTARKARVVTSITDAALERVFAAGADVLVCGHTHAREERTIPFAGSNRSLFNLGDWSQDGSYLVYKDGVFSFLHYQR